MENQTYQSQPDMSAFVSKEEQEKLGDRLSELQEELDRLQSDKQAAKDKVINHYCNIVF